MDREKGELHSQLGGELVDIINVLGEFGVPKQMIARVLVEQAGFRGYEYCDLNDSDYFEIPQKG